MALDGEDVIVSFRATVYLYGSELRAVDDDPSGAPVTDRIRQAIIRRTQHTGLTVQEVEEP